MLEVAIKKQLGSFKLDVEFSADNERLALLGSSGCGKSMTLKCIAGVEKPDEGRIVLNGKVLFDSKKRINLPPQKRHIGYLFQNYALFPNMTVLENIQMGIREKLPKNEKLKRAKEQVDAFFLAGLEDKYPQQLSGGQQQRAALARIMVSEPDMIMLDEPFSALDNFLRWELEQELMNRLEKFSGTSIMVSHDRNEVYRMAESVCVISGGKSEPKRSVKELFNDPKTVSGALLTGCKNYSEIDVIDEHTVFAKDWGVMLSCADAVHDNVTHIGVRAHYPILREEKTEEINCVECVVSRSIENVFSNFTVLEPKGTHAKIMIEKPKNLYIAPSIGKKVYLYIRPEQIMLLEKSVQK